MKKKRQKKKKKKTQSGFNFELRPECIKLLGGHLEKQLPDIGFGNDFFLI